MCLGVRADVLRRILSALALTGLVACLPGLMACSGSSSSPTASTSLPTLITVKAGTLTYTRVADGGLSSGAKITDSPEGFIISWGTGANVVNEECLIAASTPQAVNWDDASQTLRCDLDMPSIPSDTDIRISGYDSAKAPDLTNRSSLRGRTLYLNGTQLTNIVDNRGDGSQAAVVRFRPDGTLY